MLSIVEVEPDDEAADHLDLPNCHEKQEEVAPFLVLLTVCAASASTPTSCFSATVVTWRPIRSLNGHLQWSMATGATAAGPPVLD